MPYKLPFNLVLFCLSFLQLFTLSAVPSWVDWLQQLEMPESRTRGEGRTPTPRVTF